VEWRSSEEKTFEGMQLVGRRRIKSAASSSQAETKNSAFFIF
jgi:hypothetical protein